MNSDIDKKLSRLSALLKDEFLPAYQTEMNKLLEDFSKFIKESSGGVEEVLNELEKAKNDYELEKKNLKDKYGKYPELLEEGLDSEQYFYKLKVENIKDRLNS